MAANRRLGPKGRSGEQIPVPVYSATRPAVVFAAAMMVLATGTLSAVTVAVGAAASANGIWSSPTNFDGNNTLISVSCVSPTFCAAADFNGNVLYYNGSTWTTPTHVDSDAFTAISCTSPVFCAAVDFEGGALTYNGSSWTPRTDISGIYILQSLSCASPTFCVATDTRGNAYTYNGSAWSPPTSVEDNVGLQAVSCPSSAFCATLDQYGRAVTYNASTWSGPETVDPIDREGESLSCTSVTFCLDVNNNGDAITYDGSTWSAPDNISGSNELGGLSCTSPTFCLAGSENGDAFMYTGTWSAPDDIDNGNEIDSVSCTSSTFCMVVDGSGNFLTYTVPSTLISTSTYIVATWPEGATRKTGVRLIAQVDEAAPGPTPTGTVKYFLDKSGRSFNLGTATIGDNDLAEWETTPGQLPTGKDMITAIYSGDSSYSGSTSPAVIYRVLRHCKGLGCTV